MWHLKHFLLYLSFLLVFTTTGAQDDSSYQLSGGEEEEVNRFLQREIVQDDALKTKAEIFNGSRSGKYEGDRLSCPYAFERDLFVGSKGEDVRLLQVLLNSDRRTLISTSGPGSLSQETDSYGEATKDAVKKFQALFIEYVGVANGRFGPRTRTVMNAICNGENKPTNSSKLEDRQNRNIYENVFSVQKSAVVGGIVTTNVGKGGDPIPPRISLSANVSTVKLGETFKVLLNSNEEIVPVTPDSIIVDQGSVKEIRKLSKTSYSLIISTNESATKIGVQVEADKIEDLAGNKNSDASNEILVKVTGGSPKESGNISDTGGDVGLNSILDKIIASAPQCTYNGSGILITTGPDGKNLNTTGCAPTQDTARGQTYNCNGQQIPITQPCQQQNQTVCTTDYDPFTGFPRQNCQQMSPQQVQNAQRQQQNQDLGFLLGRLMGNTGFGGGGLFRPFGNPNNPPYQTAADRYGLSPDLGPRSGDGRASPWVNPDTVSSGQPRFTLQQLDNDQKLNQILSDPSQAIRLRIQADAEVSRLQKIVESCGDKNTSQCQTAQSNLEKWEGIQDKIAGRGSVIAVSTSFVCRSFIRSNDGEVIPGGDGIIKNNTYYNARTNGTNRNIYIYPYGNDKSELGVNKCGLIPAGTQFRPENNSYTACCSVSYTANKKCSGREVKLDPSRKFYSITSDIKLFTPSPSCPVGQLPASGSGSSDDSADSTEVEGQGASTAATGGGRSRTSGFDEVQLGEGRYRTNGAGELQLQEGQYRTGGMLDV